MLAILELRECPKCILLSVKPSDQWMKTVKLKLSSVNCNHNALTANVVWHKLAQGNHHTSLLEADSFTALHTGKRAYVGKNIFGQGQGA